MAPRRPERHESDGRRRDDRGGDSRAGGDAEAAESVEERQSVARDADETWASDN